MISLRKITSYKFYLPVRRGNLSNRCKNPLRPTSGAKVGSTSCFHCVNFMFAVLGHVVCRNRKKGKGGEGVWGKKGDPLLAGRKEGTGNEMA